MAIQAPRVNLLGVHFIPSDEELLSYLREKARGRPLPSGAVVEKALYGENSTPWEIFSDDDPWEIPDHESGNKGVKRVVYVFTKLCNMGPKKKSRIAGCGTWERQTKPRVIENDRKEIIGYKKKFSFCSDSQSKDHGRWIMHEYSLGGVWLEGIRSTDYVVCKITRDYSSMKGEEFQNLRISHQVLGKKYLGQEGGFLPTASSQGDSRDQRFATEAEKQGDQFAGETLDDQNGIDVLPIGREQKESRLVNQGQIDGDTKIIWASLDHVVDQC